MVRRLKVYGGLVMRADGQKRAVIAAHNAQEVADAVGATAHYIRGYWSETGNEEEITQAMASPGTLLVETSRYSGKYQPSK